MTLPSIKEIDVHGKRVLLRADLNLPMQNGKITDKTRLERVMPTIEDLSNRGAKVVVMSHFGRPHGMRQESMSLAPITDAMSHELKRPVTFIQDCTGKDVETAVGALQDRDVALLENLRFCDGEEANEATFAAGLAALGDLYVNDAFSCAHRAHASTVAVASMLPAYAGGALLAELAALDQALGTPKRPVTALVGGAKISSKLDLLDKLIDRVDVLIIGGGMANTFLFAGGFPVGQSLVETDLAGRAQDISRRAWKAGCEIILPRDVVLASRLSSKAYTDVCMAGGVPATQMILDVGPITVKAIKAAILRSQTLLWNGPLGAFETKPFDAATNQVAQYAAERTVKHGLLSVAGGGDTVAALSGAGVLADFSYVSTAGGAFLEWLEGKDLPGIAALTDPRNKALLGG